MTPRNEHLMTNDRKLAFVRWLISPPSEPTLPADAVAWWERRRFAYNLTVGAAAIVSIIIYYVSIISTGVLKPGEDVVEPVAVMAAPILAPIAMIAINICYTAGWIVDAPLRFIAPSLSPRFTSWLFAIGLGFSLVVVSFPAVYWGGYRLLQLIHFLR